MNVPSSLVYSDVYEYDFSACSYNILKNLGWNTTAINPTNKEKRNIQIGYLQRDNPRLADYIQSSMEQLIDFYLEINELSKSDVLLRQKDGIITTKRLDKIDETMPLEFRGIISKLIFTLDRKQWLILYQNGMVSVKGIRDKPCDVSFYSYFQNLDFTSTQNLINGIESFRRKIYTGTTIMWYCKEFDDEHIVVPIVGEGLIKLRKSIVMTLSSNDIEKTFLWNEYIWPFIRSILIHVNETS